MFVWVTWKTVEAVEEIFRLKSNLTTIRSGIKVQTQCWCAAGNHSLAQLPQAIAC